MAAGGDSSADQDLRCSNCKKKLGRYLSGSYRVRNGSGRELAVIATIDCRRCGAANHIVGDPSGKDRLTRT